MTHQLLRVETRTRRPNVTYHEFVVSYGRAMFRHGLALALGVFLVVFMVLALATGKIDGARAFWTSALGMALGFSFILGAWLGGTSTMQAHQEYLDYIAVSEHERAEDASPRARPIVRNGNTFHVADSQYAMSATQEQQLAQHLIANGHNWTRDGIRALRIFPSVAIDRWSLPADGNEPEGVMAYFRRVGWVDARNRSTPACQEWARRAAAGDVDDILSPERWGRGAE